MPIYEYRCSSCGFQKEFLQKVTDPLHTVCPGCGKESFQKMLSAAGFQLKGSGWYATDFKNSGSKRSSKSEGSEKASKSEGSEKASPKSEGSEKPQSAPESSTKTEPAATASGAAAAA
jgi:putative FmdB family regulatory protein